MRHFQYDVAVIGASIAGCTAATLFARRQLKVALVERNPDLSAYKRSCTHFIQSSATPTIKRLGVDGAIEAAGGIRNGTDLWTPWGWVRPAPEKTENHPSYGYSVRREKLDPLLRRIAAGTTGGEFMPGYTACDLIWDKGRVSGVRVNSRQGPVQTISARLVVAADGRYSRLAQFAGVRAQVKPHNRFCYFAYYRDLPLATGKTTQIWFALPDGAAAFPNDDDLTLLSCMPTNDKLPAWKHDLEGNFVRFFENLPGGPPLEAAKRVSKIMGIFNMPDISRPAAQAGLAFIGDAALAADPLWGVGCGWAFQSAEWLVNSTANALLENDDLDRALAQYRRRHHKALAAHDYMISDYATGRLPNTFEKLMISAAARDEGMANHLYLYMSRIISVPQFFSPMAFIRALRVNMMK